MKIALYNLTTTTKYGGVESFVWDLARELAGRGQAITIIGGHGLRDPLERESQAGFGWEQADGVLLYPRTTRDFAVEFTTHGHRIRALTLDLMQPWQKIHATLMEVAVACPTITDVGRLHGEAKSEVGHQGTQWESGGKRR